MFRRDTSAWLVVLLFCCGLSIACASNPTNNPDTSNATENSHEKSASKPGSSTPVVDASSAAKEAYARSGNSEQELEQSLQEFDEKILRELEATQQQRQENARQKAAVRSDAELEAEGGSDNEGEGEGESESEGNGEGDPQKSAEDDGSEGSKESKETASRTGETSSEAEANDKTPEGQETAGATEQRQSTPRDGKGSTTTQAVTIPTGDDDDVIARQLREAAEAETDPEVQEKLWEEYRKYKNQKGSSTSPTVP